MKNLKRSILATLLVLVLLISSAVFSFAAGTQPDSYSTESNSGQRNVVCTTLDGTSASSYYTGSYTYDSLSALSSSSLLTSLRTKLTNTHTRTSSYDDCKTMADYTDCQNNSGKLVTLYTSYVTSYDANVTNREHVWPKSLGGYETSGPGADLHHIRPTEIVPNSNRGSLKYGNVSGGTTSYGDTSGYEAGEYGSYFEPLDNVKGDVARICLYMYVRYGGDNSYTCGDVTKVFQSVEVLLAWCELDPVDTWEMGRNEVVAAYQGNRNVFIDYPEYAWLLFDQEVPNDMVTPSGEAMGESTSSGSSSPSVDNSGSGDSNTGSSTESDVATEETSVTIDFSTTAQRVSQDSNSQVWANEGVTFTNDKAAAQSNVVNSSNPVKLYSGSSVSINAPGNITKIIATCNSSSYANELQESVGSEASVSGSVVTIIPTAASTSYSVAKLTAQVRVNSIEIFYELETSAACTHTNTTTTTNDATCTEAGSTVVTCNDCHEVVSETPIPSPGHNYDGDTCTVCGNTLPTCRFDVPEGSIDPIVAVGGSVTMPTRPTLSLVYAHTYEFVGWAKSEVSDVTAAPEVYAEGETVTVEEDTTFYAVYSYSEGGSSSYVKKEISEISATDIVVITITTSDETVYALSNDNGTSSAPTAVIVTLSGNELASIPDDNIKWNITKDGDSLTIYVNGSTSTWLYCTNANNGVRVGNNSANSFTIDTSSGYLKHTGTSRYVGVYTTNPDWRCYTSTTTNIGDQVLAFYACSPNGTTYYTTVPEVSATACDHSDTTETTVDATCTEAGSVTVTCKNCGKVISTEVIEATGHTEVIDPKVDPTCTKSGLTAGSHCSVCNAVLIAQETIPMVDHNYVDGSCSACGKKDPNSGGTVTATGNIKDYADANGWTNSTLYDTVNLDENITITAAGGRDTGKYYESGESWRIYQSESGTITISANDGCTIISVKITYDSSNSGVLLNGDVQVTSGTVVAVNESSITFSVGNAGSATNGQARITDIQVIYTTSVSSDCEHTNTTTSTTATCTESGVTTVFCHDCQTIISTDNSGALGHDYVDSVCVRCGDAKSTDAPTESGWVLVTDASSLKAGDQIVIVAQGADYALSTTQNTNNRVAAAITKNGTTISINEDVQIIELEAGTVDGTFAFNTGDGYLYAASSSKNYLRTKTELDANGSWLITIDGNGVTSVVAQGTNTRNTMQYNPNGGSPIFSCYSPDSQSAIQIYKYVEGSSSEGEENIIGASITIGSTLAVNYYVSGYSEADINGYYMVFTMNGTVSEHVHGNVKNGYLVFSFTNVAPQFMGDNISATLYSSDGTELDTVAEYSIKSYSQRIMDTHHDDEELMNLVADLLRYGAAAQNYRNYKTDELVTEGFELDGLGSSEAPKDYDNIRDLVTEDGKDTSVYTFTAVGVRFDYDNKIYVKFRAEDLANVKLVINGTEIEAEGNAQDVGDGVYILYTDGVSATQFDKEFTIELHVNSELYQTITYSVNSYSYAKQESTTPYLADLVLALYRYGLSAKAYPAKANA